MFGPKIRLDPELHKKAEKHSQALGYATLAEFVTHLLEKELEPLSQEERDELNQRLQGLGYL